MAIIRTDVNGQFIQGNPKVILTNGDVISNEIVNVLTTNARSLTSLGDRPFEPTFGGGLLYYLYEPIDFVTANSIRLDCFTSLNKWIPSIEVLQNDIDVVPYADLKYYDITIYWKELITNDLGNTNFKAYHANALSPITQ